MTLYNQCPESGFFLSFVGYGTLAPQTEGGQVFFIFYAITGVPFVLLFYIHLAKILKDWANLFFSDTCCDDKFCGNRKCKKKCCEYEKNWTKCLCNAFRSELAKVSLIFLFIVAFFILIPSIFVSALEYEPWNYLETVYFAVTTLTTVGFGDFFPSSSDLVYQLAASSWLWIGLALVSTLLESASEYIKLWGKYLTDKCCQCGNCQEEVMKYEKMYGTAIQK